MPGEPKGKCPYCEYRGNMMQIRIHIIDKHSKKDK